MPTYDYVCQACGHALEIFQSMLESPKRKCPDCGKQKLKRQIGTGAALIFKGSGFYQTDYRTKSYREGAKAERKAESSGDSKSPEGSKNDGEKKSGSAKKKDKSD